MHPVCKISAVLAITPFVLAYVGCKSSSDGIQCGAGTVQSGNACVGAGGTTDAGAEGGAASAFAGVGGVAPASPETLFVTWSDATVAAGAVPVRYQIFAGPTGAPLDYTKPIGTTEPGAQSFYVSGLTSGRAYDVGVRIVDAPGQPDTNTTVKSGTPALDGTAPTFDGVKTAVAAGSGAVKLTWGVAKDDLTPATSIVYLVYVADETTEIDYSIPFLTTKPGVTTVDVPGLYDTSAIHRFVVRARDAAENVDANVIALPSRPGADKTPPEFAGCKAAFADTAGSAVVSWEVATDDATPAERIAYDVYASTDEAKWDFTKPIATQTNTTSAKVTGLTSNTIWRFVCRARDFAGNEDQNQNQRAAKTLTDSTPPSFDGLTGATVDPLARTVVLTWAPGSDDKTSPDQMTYDVYEAGKSGGQDFTQPPRASSAPGATTVTVTDLTPDTTLYWVVRARDEGGNHDSNTKEESGAISVSFSRQVQPIFTHDCGVSGCHVPGNPVANLILAPGFAYDQLVSVKATESSDMRIAPTDPDNSFLYKKISLNPPPVGWQMPAPATGSTLSAQEKDTIRRWVLQGAVNN